MKSFEVLLSKVESAKVQIEAESAEEAEDFAFERFIRGDIELADSGIPGEVSISVQKDSPRKEAALDMITIYWGDLTPAKQAEIIAAFGDNCNYDVFPIVEIPLTEEESG